MHSKTIPQTLLMLYYPTLYRMSASMPPGMLVAMVRKFLLFGRGGKKTSRVAEKDGLLPFNDWIVSCSPIHSQLSK
jgi:hypothetical protein